MDLLFEPLSTEETEMLASLIMADKYDRERTLESKEVETFLRTDFPTQVIKKRIEAMKLPISFSNSAYLATPIFAKVTGAVVILLIDCLMVYGESRKDNPITIEDICTRIYPWGKYSPEALEKRIDDIKANPKKDWNYIY